MTVVDGAGVVAQFAALAAGEHGLDLAEDRQRDRLGGFGADVEPDRAEEARALFVVGFDTVPG